VRSCFHTHLNLHLNPQPLNPYPPNPSPPQPPTPPPGSQGIYTHTVSYEKDEACPMCSAGVLVTAPVDATLQEVRGVCRACMGSAGWFVFFFKGEEIPLTPLAPPSPHLLRGRRDPFDTARSSLPSPSLREKGSL